jgi:hypothetical protein
VRTCARSARIHAKRRARRSRALEEHQGNTDGLKAAKCARLCETVRVEKSCKSAIRLVFILHGTEGITASVTFEERWAHESSVARLADAHCG